VSIERIAAVESATVPFSAAQVALEDARRVQVEAARAALRSGLPMPTIAAAMGVTRESAWRALRRRGDAA
jgi:hypothetical protein